MIDRPSSKEDEYFAKREFERNKKLDEEKQRAMAEAEKNRLRDLHYMCCPKCGMHLIEIDHKNIKIDKCSGCDGVWLDAGELEEIMSDDGGRLLGFLKMFKD